MEEKREERSVRRRTYDDVHDLAILHYTLIASPRAPCLGA